MQEFAESEQRAHSSGDLDPNAPILLLIIRGLCSGICSQDLFCPYPKWKEEIKNVSALLTHLHKKDNLADVCYRLIDKYMHQPRLMKMRKTLMGKICLPSDVASIAFAYFLNSAHPSLKYAIQFLLIQTAQNLFQALKKLILVSQVNPFEFFFDCRKQVEITRDQIR
jgi:hypothetical protein